MAAPPCLSVTPTWSHMVRDRQGGKRPSIRHTRKKKDLDGSLAPTDTLQSVSDQNVRILQAHLLGCFPVSDISTLSVWVAPRGNREEMRLSQSPAPGDVPPSNWHTLPIAYSHYSITDSSNNEAADEFGLGAARRLHIPSATLLS